MRGLFYNKINSASSPFAQKAATAQAKMKASKYTGRLFCMENMEMLPAPLQPGFMKVNDDIQYFPQLLIYHIDRWHHRLFGGSN